jgi:galactosamine-6-phosphate isomerase
MVFFQYDSLEELNEKVSDVVIEDLINNPTALLCAATGNSPTGMYKKLSEKKDRFSVEGLRFIKLDEWYGPPMDNPGTCEYYLQEHLLQPLGIKPEQYTAFVSDAHGTREECERIQHYLVENGPIDLCILGIGKNGHIAFNEPDAELIAGVHLSQLMPETLQHGMAKIANFNLEYGLTLGMADILQSKKIILMVNGPHKRDILNRLLTSNISTYLPASFLWLHPNVYCYYTEEG